MNSLALEHYDICADRGFLCRFDADRVELDGDLATARDVALNLPRWLPSGRVRSLLVRELPDTDLGDALATLSDAEARLAMVHYSFMVQAYVWGEPTPATVLPAPLARPIVALADHLGQQPLLPYSAYVLDNWARIDHDGPVTLDNTVMLQNFLGGQDEIWFVLIHVAIEAVAGSALALVEPLVLAADEHDFDGMQAGLEGLAAIWADINAIFDRMPERCDPYVYFERVRPYIHGWRDNPALPGGIVYEGTRYGTEGQAFRGQTGSQSSIVPAMDALLGVGHAADPLKTYLDQLHIYRPPAHRRFIDAIRGSSNVRGFVEHTGSERLAGAYNAVIQAIADFRSRHLEYAASYIHKQSRKASGNDTVVGTGGTPFMKYLAKHRDETRANMIQVGRPTGTG
ncbi:MAG: indoleamine 2,3-dioxygenase [Pseudomonadota bacterium]